VDEEKIQRKLTAIFSADVVSYSSLMRDDEMATINLLSVYRQVMSDLILQHKGRVVDTAGDNLLAEFSSVVDAVQSAVVIQRELKTRNAPLSDDRRMQFRIGINIGDVVQDADRIYGDGVNIAARLESIADPGGICISRSAYDQIESKLPFGYDYLGEQEAKNINKPLYAYRVILDPVNGSHEGDITKDRTPKRERLHTRGKQTGKPSDGSSRRSRDAKKRVRDAAGGIVEDPYLGQTIKEIKESVLGFAEDMSNNPEKRKRAIQAAMDNKQVRHTFGLGLTLFAINALTSFGSWWFQFPLLAVGLAYYLNWIKKSLPSSRKIQVVREKIFDEEMALLAKGSTATGREVKRIERRIQTSIRFYKSVHTYVGVNAFLMLLNLTTSPFRWWFQFPLVIWGCLLFLRWMKVSKHLPK
jgi:class 3 adenylate cyclase